MFTLYFIPSKFPRTITRSEWREIWRWKRVTQKQLITECERQRDMLITFGTTMLPQQKAEIIERMVYPPLLIHSKMDMK